MTTVSLYSPLFEVQRSAIDSARESSDESDDGDDNDDPFNFDPYVRLTFKKIYCIS